VAATNKGPEEIPRLHLYVRLGFGALVAFGLAGSCTGNKTGAAIVYVVVAVVWCMTRIVTEAIDAWQRLHPSDPPDPPPPAPTGLPSTSG
jgi:hypothetical protein